MDPSILLQKQVRDNSEDLRAYLNDLKEWEDEMKRKEIDIYSEDNDSQVPTIRKKSQKSEDPNKDEKKIDLKGKGKAKRISSYDYASWDKFDVEKECEKIDVHKKDADSSDSEDPSEEYKDLLRDEAICEKEKGNNFVRNKKWNEAIACYTHAIACYSKDPIFYANRALCFLKKDNLHSAEADCTSALQLNPTYVKALQRRAAARLGLNQLTDAVEDLKKVLELEPHNVESKNELQKLEKRLGTYKKETVPTLQSVSKQKIETVTKIKPVESQTKIQSAETSIDTEIKIEPAVSKIPAKEIVTQTIKTEIPWPTRENTVSVSAIRKPPHQRSKKPLRRIEIEETDTSEIETKIEKIEIEEIVANSGHKAEQIYDILEPSLDIDYNETNALAKILAQTTQLDVDEELKKVDIKTSTEISALPQSSDISSSKDEKSSPEKSKNDNLKTYNFPVPKSSVQFYSNWKVMKNDSEQKCLYLQNIQPEELPNIFQESLECDIFSDIILVLSEKFIEKNLSVYSYLNSLSNVKRFFALTMFMSQKDKLALGKLFEYCRNKNESSEDNINVLQKKYEL